MVQPSFVQRPCTMLSACTYSDLEVVRRSTVKQLWALWFKVAEIEMRLKEDNYLIEVWVFDDDGRKGHPYKGKMIK